MRDRLLARGRDACVVINEQRIVLGVLRGDTLSKDPDLRVADVMELGPNTLQPNKPGRGTAPVTREPGHQHWIVTTSHGTLLGLLQRADAERAVANAHARAA